MYHVEYVAGDQWKVIDENEKVAFAGTMRQVEDWLDFQENVQPKTLPVGSRLWDFVDALRGLFPKRFTPRISQPGPRLTVAEFRRQRRKH